MTMSDWLIAADFIKPFSPDKLKSVKPVDVIDFIKALYRPLSPLLWPFGVVILWWLNGGVFFQL